MEPFTFICSITFLENQLCVYGGHSVIKSIQLTMKITGKINENQSCNFLLKTRSKSCTMQSSKHTSPVCGCLFVSIYEVISAHCSQPLFLQNSLNFQLMPGQLAVMVTGQLSAMSANQPSAIITGQLLLKWPRVSRHSLRC